MAEQELAENNESTAAAMAAAAVAADIDTISDDRQNEADAVTSANRERGAEPSSSTAAVSSQQPATTYLMIKELRAISRARSLRLQPEDLVVAIDGAPFHKDIETFLDIMFECDPENGRVLTIWRKGILFNVLARGPLGCILEHAKP